MIALSLFKLFLSLLPALIYLSVIFVTIPYGTISIKKVFSYLFCGIISVGLLLVFFQIFPSWQRDLTFPFSFLGEDDGKFIMAFFQVALVEEAFKYIGFFLGKRSNNVEWNPLATMIYCGIVAFGFSFIENTHYAILYGAEVLPIRSTSTMLVHFICGLIMGYWIALGQIKMKREDTIIGVILNKFPRIKTFLFASIGIFFASSIHGLYDFNLMINSMTSNVLLILILMIGVLITYVCSKDLIYKHRNQLKT